jgi:hypothetical protein
MAITSNWCRCTSCHAGYGWKDDAFDFSDASRIDCLVCHDTTGTYKKTPTACGKEKPGLNLVKIAQNVGRPSRTTCGTCHFCGGGGDGIKHGDLDSTLIHADKSHDVHMGGKDFSCQKCHKTHAHKKDGAINLERWVIRAILPSWGAERNAIHCRINAAKSGCAGHRQVG